MSYTDAPSASPTSGIMLGARVEIIPSQPLPELNSVGGTAYAARMKNDASSSLYAILCSPNLPPRLDAINGMRNIDNPGILRLIDSGVVTWVDGQRAYAFVYQRPTAPRLMDSLDQILPPLSEDSVTHNFITPMIGALVALMNAGAVHNAIRPSNIFWRLGNAAPPQIGESLSIPAGLSQPVIFEPIERALATPLGRGQGLPVDDCYAFGVTLAYLILGKHPFQGMDDAAVINAKMQQGSFSAIVGTQRLSSSHIELLRGLLADDPYQRWTASDLDMWLSGRRMTPKNSDAGRRASRHFDFAGKEYWQAGPLAAAMATNVVEATKIIENESLHKWLARAMNDKDRATDVEDVVAKLKQSGKTVHYEDQLVARVCIALDHYAPIRYRGLAVMPGGVPSLLAEAAVSGNNIQILSEIISSELVALWIQMQKDSKADYIALGQLFDRMKNMIEKTVFGSGFERVVYEANPSLPCLSPMLLNQYVTSPKMLLPALERVAASGNRPREPMDRHIAAFLLAREKRGESLFAAIGAQDATIGRGVAILTLFSELQYRHGPDALPQLAAWLSPIAEPALRRFISKTLRDQMSAAIKNTIAVGSLTAMLRVLDDTRKLDRDRQDFLAARLLYLNIQKEIVGLESKLNNRESVVRAAGKPMAASISSFLAILLICAAIVRALFEALFQ